MSKFHTFLQMLDVNLLGDTMGSSEDPLCANERSPTQILVEGVDEGDLPAPLPGGGVVPAHHTARPVGPLDTAHVLVGHQAGRRPLLVDGGHGGRDLVVLLARGEREVGADKLQGGVVSSDWRLLMLVRISNDGFLGMKQRSTWSWMVEPQFLFL